MLNNLVLSFCDDAFFVIKSQNPINNIRLPIVSPEATPSVFFALPVAACFTRHSPTPHCHSPIFG